MWWVVFMGPVVDSRIKPLDVRIPVLHIEYEVRGVEHNSSLMYGCLDLNTCCNVQHTPRSWQEEHSFAIVDDIPQWNLLNYPFHAIHPPQLGAQHMANLLGPLLKRTCWQLTYL